ncbi:MAG TPA: NAD(P)-dependent oxidoreductase [Flavipsychrobacter sp.]|nr:NAD(P)-dependent oxidoreductase [Flavipsychrobacter sp.]
MRKKKVLIAAPVHQILTQGLADAGYELVISKNITQQLALELMQDCSGVVTSTRLQLDKELIDAAADLKWIGRMGSGMEVIDVAYATAKGIKCFSSPEGNCNAVAEHAVGMLLSLTKRITWSHNELIKGKWLREENRGVELEGKTIGIIGLGHTGRAFAKKLSGFDMRILAYDKYNRTDFPSYVEQCDSLQPIFDEAEIVSFHVPLQDDTFHYFDSEFVRTMKRPFILVNTSRGAIVDTNILFNSIREKKVIGACLDVVEGEPFSAMNEQQNNVFNQLLQLPEVLATPHIAGYSYQALFKMSKALLGKIVFFS